MEKFLTISICQLERRDKDIEKIIIFLQRIRIINKNNFDSMYRLRNDEFKVGDMVLIFDSAAVINVLAFKKFNYRWIKLYCITESDSFKGIYRVSELDSAVLRNIYINNRLKRFHVVIILDVSSRYRTSAFFLVVGIISSISLSSFKEKI